MASHERLTDKTAVPQSVERLTAPREAVGLIPGGRTNTQGLTALEMKVLPLFFKRLDVRVARITP